MTRLEEIEQERSALLRKLDTLQAEKHQLLMRKHGIIIGMLVSRGGLTFSVVGVNRWPYGDEQPWLIGNPKRKDGTFSKVERRIFSPWVKL